MKTTLSFFCSLALASVAHAFSWPGGTMTIPVTAFGHEEFAGWAPSSPWGTGNWTSDPTVVLRDGSGNVVAQYVLTGGAGDWFDGGSRSGTAVFSVGPGNYSLSSTTGRKHQLINGEGYSGYSLTISSLPTPTPPNSAPSASMTGSTSLQVGQTGTWTFSASDPDGNLSAWRFRASTNPGAGWASISGGSAGPASYSTSFGSAGTYTWIIEVQDAGGLSASASVTVTVTAPPPPNAAPTASISGSTALLVGQTGTWTFSASDANGNLSAWRFRASTNPSAGWSPISGGSAGPASYSTSFASAGTYTWIVDVQDSGGLSASASVTVTVTAPPPPNVAPTIAWNTAPGTVASGQSYTISAHGHDQDGNLTAVSVWKNGSPFAFGGGGNGFDADSGNTTSDTGPQSITYTARATDSNGATSAAISQTVTVTQPNRTPTASISGSTALQVGQTGSWTFNAADPDGNLSLWRFRASTNPGAGWSPASGGSVGPGSYSASFAAAGTYTWIVEAQDAGGLTGSASITVVVTAPVNNAPAIAWNVTPGSVASGQSYTISAHGHDQDGNLTQVNVWKNGSPFAFAGGGNGFDGDSSNATSDTGPQSITYTASAVDSSGGNSGTISQVVTINAPPAVVAAISVAPTSGTAPASTTVAWSSSNATSVAVSGPSVSSAAANGSQSVTGLAVGSYTWTITAQGTGGPLTRSATFTVSAPPPSVTATIAASPTSGTEPLATTISWSTNNATSVAISGPGLSSAAASGSQLVSGLAAGSYTWTLTAQGNGGPVTQTCSVTVSAAPMFALTTSTSGGGVVTAGGNYPAGSIVTISAASDAVSRFTGWSGDVSGSANSVAVTMDRAKFAQANFVGKAAQTISFPQPADRAATSGPFGLSASATSGLPVSFALVSGPATLSGLNLTLTGAGPVTVQATQAGDGFYLPAPAVSQTFNATAFAAVKYRTGGRTLLEGSQARDVAPLVIEKP